MVEGDDQRPLCGQPFAPFERDPEIAPANQAIDPVNQETDRHLRPGDRLDPAPAFRGQRLGREAGVGAGAPRRPRLGGGGGLAQQVAQEEHPGERLFREDHPGFALQRAGNIDPVERVDAEVELRRRAGIEILVREARLQPSPHGRGPGIVEQRAIVRRPLLLRPLPSRPALRRRLVRQHVTAQSTYGRPWQRPA